jgi:hypothetical protein
MMQAARNLPDANAKPWGRVLSELARPGLTQTKETSSGECTAKKAWAFVPSCPFARQVC